METSPQVEPNPRPEGFRSKWDLIGDKLKAALEKTKCNLDCSGCGVHLETEADFAKHFHIPDERYVNMGECPYTDRGREAMARRTN